MKYVDFRTGEDVPAAEVKPLGGNLFAHVFFASTCFGRMSTKIGCFSKGTQRIHHVICALGF